MTSMPDELKTVARDPLVTELETALREFDLLVGTRAVGAWAESSELSLEEAHLLVVLARRRAGTTARELAEASGVAIDAVYPALHRLRKRGHARAHARRYSPTDAGRNLVACLEAARRTAIEAYVERLAPAERRRLEDKLESG